MSDPASRLPARPSLEQLRKQAKDLLRQYRAGDADAAATRARRRSRDSPMRRPRPPSSSPTHSSSSRASTDSRVGRHSRSTSRA